MKTVLLFLSAICLTAFISQAQEHTYSPFRPQPLPPAKGVRLSTEEMNRMLNSSPVMRERHSAQKTTLGATTHSNWYDMWAQNYSPSRSVAYYYAVQPDSNMIDNSGPGTPDHVRVHGMGQSFDPTDSAYYSTTFNGGACLSPIPAYDILSVLFLPYVIDSFAIPIVYKRNDPVPTRVDSLIIELIVNPIGGSDFPDSGVYHMSGTFGIPWPDVCSYGVPSFTTIHYNGGYGNIFGAPYNAPPYINDCFFDSVFAPKQRFAFALDAAAAADTDANGFLNLGHLTGMHFIGIAAPTAIVPGTAGQYALAITPDTINYSGSHFQMQNMATFVSFKPQASYPPGTLASSANWIREFAGEPNGPLTWWMQSCTGWSHDFGSSSMSLIADNSMRYNDTGFVVWAHGHNMLKPSVNNYTSPYPPGYDVTEQAFHITWYGLPASISNIGSNETRDVSAYPNPSNETLTISCAANANTSVSATLTNMIGQIVASQLLTDGKVTFNTAELPAGIYIYTLQGAGQRVSGKVVITH